MSNFINERDSIETKLEQIDKLVGEIQQKHKKQVEDFEITVNNTWLKPKPYIDYPNTNDYVYHKWRVGGYPDDLFKIKAYFHRKVGTLKELDEWKDGAINVIQRYITDCTKIKEENDGIQKHNDSVRKQVRTVMEELGIPSSYRHSYCKTSRSRKKTTTTERAGYEGDLDRLIGSPKHPSLLEESYTQQLDFQYNRLKNEILEKEREDAKKRELEEQQHGIALLRAKYTPGNAHSDYGEILDTILEKDKYLKLAHYLRENRNDWSDGCNYAEIGFNSFTVESTVDKEIEDCIFHLITDWEGDGRVFRDCEYDYGTIFGMVEDKQLMSDYNKIVELVGDY